MSQPQVLVQPSGLSGRARDFLAAHARVVPVGTGPGEDECRAEMRAALGYCDESALATLRRIQRRYSGLAFTSRLRDSEIVFEPVLDVDPDTGEIVFGSAIMDAAPDGCRSGFVRPDGTLWFGLFETDAQAFPSLDHFLECEALLHHAHRRRPLSTETPPDADEHLAVLRGRYPRLRPVDAASGFCVGWWSDGERLVFANGLDARLAADGRGASPVPTVVTTWLGEPRPSGGT
ncbi:hypothetical protein [Asanoa siamensis]|uniref:SUKH-3 immunity protein of toxin-antitoxin system n=1 Tax=Asanoa siamensis TaxID=926357 RepID=A0ABQ4CNA8_9ACTN|nr:hypothetical protein [Asanoa siamensis]GIF72778.1 hypothetical protein Asi02nite_22960 [Asanoa siamensis]